MHSVVPTSFCCLYHGLYKLYPKRTIFKKHIKRVMYSCSSTAQKQVMGSQYLRYMCEVCSSLLRVVAQVQSKDQLS